MVMEGEEHEKKEGSVGLVASYDLPHQHVFSKLILLVSQFMVNTVMLNIWTSYYKQN